jgi:hypothetical protein
MSMVRTYFLARVWPKSMLVCSSVLYSGSFQLFPVGMLSMVGGAVGILQMGSKSCYGMYISCHVCGASCCIGKQQLTYKAWIVSGGA